MCRIVYFACLLIFVFSACDDSKDSLIENDNGGNIENNMSDSEIEKLVLGEWHYWSGEISVGLINDSRIIFDKILNFNKSFNYTEKYCEMNRHGVAPIASYVETYGNWKVLDKKLVLNDWVGDVVLALYVEKLSDDMIIFRTPNGETVTYKRVGTEFDDVYDKILGYWYEYSISYPKSDYYHFKNDGFVSHRSYVWMDGPNANPVITQGEQKWSLQDNDEILFVSYPVQNTSRVCKIEFLNESYFCYGDAVLKNTNWTNYK